MARAYTQATHLFQPNTSDPTCLSWAIEHVFVPLVQGHASSLRIPQDQDHRIASQKQLADESLLVDWTGFLPLPRSRRLNQRRERTSVYIRRFARTHSVGWSKASASRHVRWHTSVHISFTFSRIMLQCRSNARTLASSFLLFLQLIRTCVLALTLDVSTDSGPERNAESSSLVVPGSLSIATVRFFGQPSVPTLPGAPDPLVRRPHLISLAVLRLMRLSMQLGFWRSSGFVWKPVSSSG